MAKLFVLIAAMSLLFGCNTKVKVNPDDLYDEPFFAKARLIMTKKELKLYKNLSGKESKEEFIKSFWKRRDPDPRTKINEFKVEFYRRVNYSNYWFWKTKSSKKKGWNTDRGRIYIILGPPDHIVYRSGMGIDTEYWEGRRNRISKKWEEEIWYYYKRKLRLFFKKSGYNNYKLGFHGGELTYALKAYRKSYIYDLKEKMTVHDILRVHIDQNTLILEIPTKEISFLEEENKMKAQLKVNIDLYQKKKKFAQISRIKTIIEDPQKLLDQENIMIKILLNKDLKGKVKFFIEIKDLVSLKFFDLKKTFNF